MVYSTYVYDFSLEQRRSPQPPQTFICAQENHHHPPSLWQVIELLSLCAMAKEFRNRLQSSSSIIGSKCLGSPSNGSGGYGGSAEGFEQTLSGKKVNQSNIIIHSTEGTEGLLRVCICFFVGASLGPSTPSNIVYARENPPYPPRRRQATVIDISFATEGFIKPSADPPYPPHLPDKEHCPSGVAGQVSHVAGTNRECCSG